MADVIPGVEDEPAPRAWPAIPDDMLKPTEHLVDVLAARRGTGISSSWEQGLWERVEELVADVAAQPEQFGLPATLGARLEHQAAWRETFEWATLVRASVLWPLSTLIYGSDVEEIRRLGGRWLVESGSTVEVLEGNEPDDFLAGSPLDVDIRLEEWFRILLATPGVVGSRGLSIDQPLSEAVVSSAAGPVRIAVAIAPVVTGRSRIAVTVRVPRASGPQSLTEFVRMGTMPRGVAQFLKACILARLNLVIAGGTGTGKTTLLRALAAEIPGDEMLVAIEDTAELELDQPRKDGRPWHPRVMNLAATRGSWKGVTNPVTMEDLVRTALRHRPHRILLGEARGGEMADVAAAMTSGHEGSMVTVHANSALEARERCVMYVAQSSAFRSQHDTARRLIDQAVDVCIHIGRDRRTGARRITGVIAYGESGQPVPIYDTNDAGEIVRELTALDTLPKRIRRALDGVIRQIPPL